MARRTNTNGCSRSIWQQLRPGDLMLDGVPTTEASGCSRTPFAVQVVISIFAGLLGVGVGAYLSRRNARRDHADKLLAEALNELVSAVADVAGGNVDARRRYAGATSRIVLYGSPELVSAFHAFQADATTGQKTVVIASSRPCRWRGANLADLQSMRPRLPCCSSARTALGLPDDANGEMLRYPRLVSHADFEIGQRADMAWHRALRLAGSMRH